MVKYLTQSLKKNKYSINFSSVFTISTTDYEEGIVQNLIWEGVNLLYKSAFYSLVLFIGISCTQDEKKTSCFLASSSLVWSSGFGSENTISLVYYLF